MSGPPLPTVSVIIPAYGVAHLVADALTSLQAQTRTDWEAIVIDDGAPDDVEGALKPFKTDDRIHLVMTGNAGLSTARNRAIAASRAPFIALLDGDDMLEPTYLEEMVGALESDPKIGLVSCDATYFGASRVGERFSAYVNQKPLLTLGNVLSRTFNVYISALFRRAAFDQAGGFDTSLDSAEDLDLWLRILEAGWAGAYVARPLGRYRRRDGQMSSNRERLLAAEDRVYSAAEARLSQRPEIELVHAARRRIAMDIAQCEGEALIMSGQSIAGIKRLHDSQIDKRSARWAVILPIMRLLPFMAKPLLHLRDRLN